MLDVPLQHALGARLLDDDNPGAGLCFPATGLAATPYGTMHAGALGSIMEAAGFLVVLPHLDPAEHAVTHASSIQYLSSAAAGELVTARGTLLRRGRTLAFVSVTAEANGKVLSHAQITKSIVPRP